MKRTLLALTVCLSLAQFTIAEAADWKAVEQIFNRSGNNQGEMFKVTFPRTDLNVKIGSVHIEPGLALTSWAAFKPMGRHYMAMGDLVLLDTELEAAQKALIANGFTVSGIHNHIAKESPSVIYMHFDGHGDPVQLSQKLKEVLALTGTPMTSVKKGAPASLIAEKASIESILKVQGKQNGNVLNFSIPRQEIITEEGMEVPPFMGMATAINFQKANKGQMATTGDFVLLADEVASVVDTLVKHGITVTAVHNHMLKENPRLFFLHFWGVDTSENLAKALKTALEQTGSKL